MKMSEINKNTYPKSNAGGGYRSQISKGVNSEVPWGRGSVNQCCKWFHSLPVCLNHACLFIAGGGNCIQVPDGWITKNQLPLVYKGEGYFLWISPGTLCIYHWKGNAPNVIFFALKNLVVMVNPDIFQIFKSIKQNVQKSWQSWFLLLTISPQLCLLCLKDDCFAFKSHSMICSWYQVNPISPCFLFISCHRLHEADVAWIISSLDKGMLFSGITPTVIAPSLSSSRSLRIWAAGTWALDAPRLRCELRILLFGCPQNEFCALQTYEVIILVDWAE